MQSERQMTTPIEYGLGRKVNHDPRSRNFPAPRATDRKPVMHRRWGQVLDQGSLGSCTGNAMAQALNMRPLHTPGTRFLKEEDAVALYQRATQLDPFPGAFPPDDTGSDGLSVCKAAAEKGLIKSYQWAFGFDHALDALQNGPVLVGLPWHNSMFTPDSDGYLHPDGNKVGGHETVLFGDDCRDTLTVLNSWGKNWGRSGRYKLSYATFKELLADQGDVAVPVRA
jgi:hypothetical protein